MNKLLHWLQPPRIDDPYEQVVYSALHYTLQMFFVALVITMLSLKTYLHVTMVPSMLLVIAISYRLLRQHRLEGAGIVFLSGGWVITTVTVYALNGLNSVTLYLQVIAVVLANVIFPKRTLALLFTALGVGSILVLAIGQIAGLLPLITTPPLMLERIWIPVFTLSAAGLLTAYSSKALRDSNKRLRQSREALAQAERITGLGSYIWDLRTNEVVWSDSMKSLLGCENETPSIELFRSRIHPDDRERAKREASSSRQAGNPMAVEYRLLLPDGTVRHVRDTADVVQDDAGRTVLMFGSSLDITERKQAENRLYFQAQLLASVRESVVATDLQAKITYWGNGAEALYGYTAAEALGQDIRTMIEAESQDEARQRIRTVHETGVWQGWRLRQRKDGTHIWVDTILSLVKDNAGETIGYLGIDREITQEKQLRETLYFVAEQTWAVPSNQLFAVLVEYLGKTLGVDYAFVGRLTAAGKSVDTMAFYAKGQLVDNITYDLDGTPCENATQHGMRCYREGVQQLFPGDALLQQMGVEGYMGLALRDSAGQSIGIIVLMDTKPLNNLPVAETVLQLMANRAAHELERSMAEAALHYRDAILRALNAFAERLLKTADWRSGIGDALEILGVAAGVDRLIVWQNYTDDHGAARATPFAEWAAPGIARWMDDPKNAHIDVRQAGYGNLLELWQQQQTTVSHLDELPADEQRLDHRMRNLSWVVMPVTVAGQLWGIISFDMVREKRNWSKTEIEALQTVGRMFGAAIERAQSAEALRLSEDRLRLIIDTMCEVILQVDGQGIIRHVDSTKHMPGWGIAPEELLGSSAMQWIDRIHPEDRDTVKHVFAERLASGVGPDQVICRFRHASGEYRWKEIFVSSYKHAGGSAAGFIYAVRDITQRKRTDQLARARIRLSEYALTHSLDELMQATIDEAEYLTSSEIGFFHIVEPDQVTLRLQAWSTRTIATFCTTDVQGWHDSVDRAGVWVDAVRQRQPVIHNDYASLPDRRGLPEGHTEVIREVVVPVFQDDLVVALIGVGNKLADYDEADVGILGQLAYMAWDIIMRKRAEESLRDREALYRLLAENSADVIMLYDAQLKPVYVSPACERMLGFTPAEIQAMPINTLVHPQDLPDLLEKIRQDRAMRAVTAKYEFRVRHKDGHYLWVEEMANRTYDHEVNVVQLLVVFREISERKQFELALQDSEAQYRLLFNTMLDGFALHEIICDEQGTPVDYRFLQVNPAFERLTGLKASEVIGRTALEVLPQLEDSWISNYGSIALTGTSMRFENFAADLGKYFEVIAFRPGQNQFATLFFDVTERKRTEQLEREHERLKASFQKEQERNALVQRIISALSHDLRTPFTVITTARFLLEQYYDRLPLDKRQEQLDKIEHQTQFAIRLLEDTVQMLRGNVGEQEFHPAPVNLSALCAVSVQEIGSAFQTHHQLRFVPLSNVETVTVDETLVNRILLNLLSNAIKYSPDGSEIRLELDRRDNWVILRVIDQGVGISKDDLPHIFEAFFRVEAIKHQNISGTGLGLSIVRDCVERHRGQINVESELGKGTTFTVELPLNAA